MNILWISTTLCDKIFITDAIIRWKIELTTAQAPASNHDNSKHNISVKTAVDSRTRERLKILRWIVSYHCFVISPEIFS